MLGLAAAISIVLAQTLSGARVEPIRVTYHVPPQCPDKAQFLAEVSSRTSLARQAVDGETAREFVIDIEERSDKSLSGALAIRSVDGVASRREIAGSRCSEVVTALALMVALAVDPEGALLSAPSAQAASPAPQPPSTDARPPVATWSVPPAASDAATPTVPPSGVQAPAPPSGGPASVPPPRPDAPRAAPPRPALAAPEHAPPSSDMDARQRERAHLGHWAIGAQGQALVGIVTTSAIGAGATLDYVSDHDRVSAMGLRFALSAVTAAPTLTEGVGARLVWAWARAEWSPFRLRLASALRLAPYLGADAGVLWFRGTGLQNPASDARPWFGADVMARLSWTSLAGWLIDVGLGAQVPFEREALQYRVGDATRTASQLAPVAFEAELGLARWLP